MKNTLRLLLMVVAASAAACNRTPPERQALFDAADAMGGRQKVLEVKTLTIEGEGDAPNVGQNTMPDGELPNWRRTAGSLNIVEIDTGKGDHLTLAMDATTKLPSRVTSMTDNANLGDVAIDTAFLDYETVGGLKLPKRITTKVDRYPQFDLRISKN